MDATLKLDGVDLTNEASTIVTDKLTATARMRARLTDADTALQIDIAGKQGQVLVNPVLLDFGKNPLALEVRGNLKGDVLKVDSLRLTQTDLIELTGNGQRESCGRYPRGRTATSSSRGSSSRRRTAATCRSRWPPPACSAIFGPAVV